MTITEIVLCARRAGCPADLESLYGDDSCGLAAAICRELARRGDGEFFLGHEILGDSLGVSHTVAGACLNALMMDRVIAKVRRHCRRKKQATTYRYLRSLK